MSGLACLDRRMLVVILTVITTTAQPGKRLFSFRCSEGVRAICESSQFAKGAERFELTWVRLVFGSG